MNIYLTIDDSPSARTDDLVAFLTSRDIPALLFVRGDNMEQYPRAIARAQGIITAFPISIAAMGCGLNALLLNMEKGNLRKMMPCAAFKIIYARTALNSPSQT